MIKTQYKILRLSDLFYATYPNPPCKEILEKRSRAYNCLLIQAEENYCICIPYRSEITHRYAYHFKKSNRSLRHKSGLDYSKIVIIRKYEYLDSESAVIDKDEFKETVTNIQRIKKEAMGFVDDYVKHMKGIRILHISEFKRRYQYSPLKYFHAELGVI